jgi:hypothetical protein
MSKHQFKLVCIYENKLEVKSLVLSPITNNPLRMEISPYLIACFGLVSKFYIHLGFTCCTGHQGP